MNVIQWIPFNLGTDGHDFISYNLQGRPYGRARERHVPPGKFWKIVYNDQNLFI